MLIKFENIKKYGVNPVGVIHVGMHTGEEFIHYKRAGVKNMVFIEANEQLVNSVISAPFWFQEDNVHIYHAAVSDTSGELVKFNITNNSQSSSILELGDHSIFYPGIVNVKTVEMLTTTLDDIYHSIEDPNYNILNLDIQGAELKAMLGFSHWDKIDAVFTEVNFREMYKGCPLVDEIDNFLKRHGLKKVEQFDTGSGWGDALYIREND